VRNTPHSVFFTQLTESPELSTASQKIFSDWSANYRVENLDLPVLLEMLLRELPPSIKMVERIRVNAEKDT
jgi:hypothetical protein